MGKKTTKATEKKEQAVEAKRDAQRVHTPDNIWNSVRVRARNPMAQTSPDLRTAFWRSVAFARGNEVETLRAELAERKSLWGRIKAVFVG